MHRLLESKTFLLIKKNNSTCPPTPPRLPDPVNVPPVLPQTRSEHRFSVCFLLFLFYSQCVTSVRDSEEHTFSTALIARRHAQTHHSLLSSAITAVAIWLESGQSPCCAGDFAVRARALRVLGATAFITHRVFPGVSFFLLLSFL